jgi:hypothetical protein
MVFDLQWGERCFCCLLHPARLAPSQPPVTEGPVALPQDIIQLEQKLFSTQSKPALAHPVFYPVGSGHLLGRKVPGM